MLESMGYQNQAHLPDPTRQHDRQLNINNLSVALYDNLIWNNSWLCSPIYKSCVNPGLCFFT